MCSSSQLVAWWSNTNPLWWVRFCDNVDGKQIGLINETMYENTKPLKPLNLSGFRIEVSTSNLRALNTERISLNHPFTESTNILTYSLTYAHTHLVKSRVFTCFIGEVSGDCIFSRITLEPDGDSHSSWAAKRPSWDQTSRLFQNVDRNGMWFLGGGERLLHVFIYTHHFYTLRLLPFMIQVDEYVRLGWNHQPDKRSENV